MGECSLELPEDLVVPPEDVFGEKSDGRVALGGRREVAATVPAMRGPVPVVRATVALNDEPSVDEEVHAPDAVDPHLQVDVASQRAKHQADERLDPGFRAPVDESPQPTIAAREECEHGVDRAFVDQSSIPRAVEARDRVAGALASAGLRERTDDVGRQRVPRLVRSPPVRDDALRSRREATGSHLELEVEATGGPHEHTEHGEERDAVEAATEASRHGQLVGEVGRCESAATESTELALRHEPLPQVPTDSPLGEVLSREKGRREHLDGRGRPVAVVIGKHR